VLHSKEPAGEALTGGPDTSYLTRSQLAVAVARCTERKA